MESEQPHPQHQHFCLVGFAPKAVSDWPDWIEEAHPWSHEGCSIIVKSGGHSNYFLSHVTFRPCPEHDGLPLNEGPLQQGPQ